jgi:hypothetical protein
MQFGIEGFSMRASVRRVQLSFSNTSWTDRGCWFSSSASATNAASGIPEFLTPPQAD